MHDHPRRKPDYEEIVDDLQVRIKGGELAVGAQIPGVEELCERWQCPPRTARRALTALRNMGLIDFVRDRGALVAQDPPLVRVAWERHRRPHRQTTYAHEAERSGLALDVERGTERVEAPAEVAERLCIEEGDPVTETFYEISMGDQPVSVSVTWEPLAITGGTPIELPHEGPHAGTGTIPRFDAIGYQVDAEEEILRIRPPERSEQAQLAIAADVPVVQIWQTFWADDYAVQISKILFRADRYDFFFRTNID